MTEEEKRIDAETRRLAARPEPPEDPTENAEFEDWSYIENGEWVTVRRKNPSYKAPNTPTGGGT